MAALKEEIKQYIVQALACYDTPQQVSEQLKEEFGLVVERPQVQSYDPTKVQGRSLSKKYKDLFEATRAKFLEAVSEIPIANQAVRLRSLQRMHDKAMRGGNSVLAASLLEQVAREVGGNFTNKTKAEVELNAKHQHQVSKSPDVSREEWLKAHGVTVPK